jgi:transposase
MGQKPSYIGLKVAMEFNRKHGKHITHGTVAKLIEKFEKTGSFSDKPRSGRPRTSATKAQPTWCWKLLQGVPPESTQRLAVESGVTRLSIVPILKKHKWHQYKMRMLQHVNENDQDRRMEFCEWAVNKLDCGADFSSGILFTDEANFYVNGEVNHQNVRYCTDTNPHWMNPSKVQGAGKVMVWCGIWGKKIVGSVFFDTNLRAEMYLNML